MKKILQWFFAFGPFLALLFVSLLFLWLCPPSFRDPFNLKLILTQTVIFGIGAIGMTFVVISGGIDLSVGSLVALSTVVTASALNAAGDEASTGMVLACAAAGAGACALLGLVNGLLITKLRIVPFIVTLGMMQIVRGIAKWKADSQTIVCPESWLDSLMDVSDESFLPAGVWVMLALLLVCMFVLRKTVFGRHVYAIGSNEDTARLCGIRVTLNRILIYMIGAGFAGIAGIMQYANLTVGDPTAAVGYELDIIAAVVIGGGSLNGGQGSALGSLVGALIMAILRNGCNILGVEPYVQDIIIGAVIVGAVAIDNLRHRLEA